MKRNYSYNSTLKSCTEFVFFAIASFIVHFVSRRSLLSLPPSTTSWTALLVNSATAGSSRGIANPPWCLKAGSTKTQTTIGKSIRRGRWTTCITNTTIPFDLCCGLKGRWNITIFPYCSAAKWSVTTVWWLLTPPFSSISSFLIYFITLPMPTYVSTTRIWRYTRIRFVYESLLPPWPSCSSWCWLWDSISGPYPS